MNQKIKLINAPAKIKINLSDFPIDPNKQQYFMGMLTHDQQEISQNENNYNLAPQMTGANQVNYQYWQFSFECGEGCFAGKQISGVLKFPPDFPTSAPKFFFDPLPNGEVIQHENIYGDNLLCIPLLSHWNSQTSTFEILQAIEHIFANPNWGEGDAPANPTFTSKKAEEKHQIQSAQAKLLPAFEKD